MAIWYFDPDGGNQSNDGQSFANRKKYVEYSNRAQFSTGDEIRFIKSSDPTSLGNALWTTDAAKYHPGNSTPTFWTGESAFVSSGSYQRDTTGVFSRLGPNPISCVDTGHGLDTKDTIAFKIDNSWPTGAFEITKVDNDNFTLDGTGVQTRRSVDFDGTDDYLSVASSSDLTFGTGDFTVELWAYPDDFGSRGTLYDSRPSGGTDGITIGHEVTSGEIRVYMTATSGSDIVVQSSDFATGQWQHIAVTRESGTVRLFINGALKDTETRTTDLDNTNAVNIGYKTYTSSSYSYFDGKISNLRVVKGTAVYTSAFTTPTGPLTNITNIKLLCCNNSSTTGSTITPGTITANSSPTASTLSPFDWTDVSKTYYTISPFRVLLETACTKNIICYQSEEIGDLDWTATLGTTAKETTNKGVFYQTNRQFKPGTSGTGKAAYVTLDSALDLSGYQQISFMVFWDYLSTSQEDDDSIMSLRLCTDTTGDTSVHTIPITHGMDFTDDWYAVVHDFGTNLNASIQSVAIYVDTTLAHANTEVHIDNVIACKAKSSADSLTHASLISKGNTHDDVWFSLIGIDNKKLLVKSWSGNANVGLWGNSGQSPYPGATETVTTYKRECFRRPTFRSTTERRYSPFFTIDETVYIGSGNSYNISGGWNTTDMSSQDTNSGTWFDCIHPEHYSGIFIQTTNDLTISKFGLVNGRQGVLNLQSNRYDGRGTTLNNINTVSTLQGHVYGPDFKYNNCVFTTCNFERDDEGFNYQGHVLYKDCTFYNVSWDVNFERNFRYIVLLNPTIRGTLDKNSGMVFHLQYRDVKVLGGSINNVKHLFTNQAEQSAGGRFRMSNTLINNDSALPIDAIEEKSNYNSSSYMYGENQDWHPPTIINYNNVATDHRIYFFGAEVTSETSVRNTASGIAWKMRVWNTSYYNARREANYVKWRFAETAVNASAQVTLTAYVRRSHTDFNVKLAALMEDNYHMGVTSDITVTASGSADAWEQLTLNVTPTAAGTIEFTCLFSLSGTLIDGTPDQSQVAYLDDIAITQA